MDFQCCQPRPGGWEPGKNCRHPSLFWKNCTLKPLISTPEGSLSSHPIQVDGSKTINLLRDLPPTLLPAKEKTSHASCQRF